MSLNTAWILMKIWYCLCQMSNQKIVEIKALKQSWIWTSHHSNEKFHSWIQRWRKDVKILSNLKKTWVESLKPEDEHQEKTWKSLAERNDVHKKVEVEKAQNTNPNMEKNSHQGDKRHQWRQQIRWKKFLPTSVQSYP